jgi:hypothetical protein
MPTVDEMIAAALADPQPMTDDDATATASDVDADADASVRALEADIHEHVRAHYPCAGSEAAYDDAVRLLLDLSCEGPAYGYDSEEDSDGNEDGNEDAGTWDALDASMELDASLALPSYEEVCGEEDAFGDLLADAAPDWPRDADADASFAMGDVDADAVSAAVPAAYESWLAAAEDDTDHVLLGRPRGPGLLLGRRLGHGPDLSAPPSPALAPAPAPAAPAPWVAPEDPLSRLLRRARRASRSALLLDPSRPRDPAPALPEPAAPGKPPSRVSSLVAEVDREWEHTQRLLARLAECL